MNVFIQISIILFHVLLLHCIIKKTCHKNIIFSSFPVPCVLKKNIPHVCFSYIASAYEYHTTISFDSLLLHIEKYYITKQGIGIPDTIIFPSCYVPYVISRLNINDMSYNDFTHIHNAIKSIKKYFSVSDFKLLSNNILICKLYNNIILELYIWQEIDYELYQKIKKIEEYYDNHSSHIKKPYHYLSLTLHEKNKITNKPITKKEYYELFHAF
jgi:hypothetical protein